MTKHSCETCLFSDSCSTNRARACKHYSPIEEDIEEYIENRRSEFRDEWFQYIEEYDS